MFDSIYTAYPQLKSLKLFFQKFNRFGKKIEFSKVVTHNGVFHADEILSIAFLRLMHIISYTTPIERVKRSDNISKYLSDKRILVLDIGLNYNPEKGNFDHHQDKNLEATNMLVLKYFLSENKIMVEKLSEYLFGYVSNTDRGIGDRKNVSASFNGIIKSFYDKNKEDCFYKAIDIAERILCEYIRNVELTIEGELKWKYFNRVENGKIVIMKDSDPYVSSWKKLAREENVYFLINPNQEDLGSYNMTSYNSKTLPIEKHPDQKFLHNSNFFAIYSSLNSAIEHATIMIERHEEKIKLNS